MGSYSMYNYPGAEETIERSFQYATTDENVITALSAIFGAFLGFFLVIVLIIAILQIIGYWKVFTKAGEKGWKSIIPIYNVWTLFKISGLSPWMIFAYLLVFIPFIGWIISICISVYQCNSLAKSFGKDVGYTVGLFFLPTIFYMILGLGKATYVGPGGRSDTNFSSDGVVEIKEKEDND